jgi:hypothetical protein
LSITYGEVNNQSIIKQLIAHIKTDKKFASYQGLDEAALTAEILKRIGTKNIKRVLKIDYSWEAFDKNKQSVGSDTPSIGTDIWLGV